MGHRVKWGWEWKWHLETSSSLESLGTEVLGSLELEGSVVREMRWCQDKLYSTISPQGGSAVEGLQLGSM